jgi:hypothetical protein
MTLQDSKEIVYDEKHRLITLNGKSSRRTGCRQKYRNQKQTDLIYKEEKTFRMIGVAYPVCIYISKD